MKYIAKTLSGLEEVLEQEIIALGGTNVQQLKRGVLFEGPEELMYEANLQLRTALRILWVIEEFEAFDEQILYYKIKRLDWSEHLDTNMTFAIDGVSSSEYFTHSKYLALKCKDAIADYFMENYRSRPSVDVESPDVRINIHVREGSVTLSLDSSGQSLHKRGDRKSQGPAPINEVLAAGMILLSGWDKESPFLDPMCGSGTILMEAAKMAIGCSPHHQRRTFGFERWKSFDGNKFVRLRRAALKRKPNKLPKIIGYDIHPRALENAQENIGLAKLYDHVELGKLDAMQIKLDEAFTIITNPPYNKRLELRDVENFYRELGTAFKHGAEGSTLWMIAENTEGVKQFGLRPSRKIDLYNGKIPCKYFKYDLYKGSKRRPEAEEE